MRWKPRGKNFRELRLERGENRITVAEPWELYRFDNEVMLRAVWTDLLAACFQGGPAAFWGTREVEEKGFGWLRRYGAAHGWQIREGAKGTSLITDFCGKDVWWFVTTQTRLWEQEGFAAAAPGKKAEWERKAEAFEKRADAVRFLVQGYGEGEGFSFSQMKEEESLMEDIRTAAGRYGIALREEDGK